MPIFLALVGGIMGKSQIKAFFSHSHCQRHKVHVQSMEISLPRAQLASEGTELATIEFLTDLICKMKQVVLWSGVWL